MHILLCGTHPRQFNGYSKVVHQLSCELARIEGVQVSLFAFQNFYDDQAHASERSLPSSVTVYDAVELERSGKSEAPATGLRGFGEAYIVEVVEQCRPDVVLLYNDLSVLSSFLSRLNAVQDRPFRILTYVDLVYKFQKANLIQFVDQNCDGALFFTQGWLAHARKDMQTFLNKPCFVVEHALDTNTVFPVDKRVARAFFGISDDDFVILNLNRNEPRKRWDVCVAAFVRLLAMHQDDPHIKLLVATALQGAWDLRELLGIEARKAGLTLEHVLQHLILVRAPQQLTDYDVNLLYSAADVGLNTCDGEGFGLCTFEHAAVGVPQIAPAIGGLLDVFATPRGAEDSGVMLLQPRWSYYVDSGRDAVGGEAEVLDVDDVVSALQEYHADPEARCRLGRVARERLLKDARFNSWAHAASVIHRAAQVLTAPPPQPKTEPVKSMEPLLAPIIEEIEDDDEQEVLQNKEATPTHQDNTTVSSSGSNADLVAVASAVKTLAEQMSVILARLS